MDSDIIHNDTQRLEQALIQQAESLAREQLERAESGKVRILQEAVQRRRLAEENEILAARAEAEKWVRQQVQAARTRLAAELDRLRWALSAAALDGVKTAFRELVANEARYLTLLEVWLAVAARDLPPGPLIAEVRAGDQDLVTSAWEDMKARAAPEREIELATLTLPSEGGMLLRTADDRARFDQTFEARQSRMLEPLVLVTMEHLFAGEPELSELPR